MEHEGYILIADITGYTVYLNESELDHAKGTLTDLLELLIDQTKPPLVINRLEGDAVVSYGLEEAFVNPQTFLESIEDTYVAFRKAIELMILNNTCKCNACANVSTLDLKFFIHHGTFALQRVGENDELMGTDVNLIHRLLKNSVTDQTGVRAYILCTDAAERALGLDGVSETLVEHTETLPDFGEVKVWVRDMHPVYEARRDELRIEYSPDEIFWTETIVVGVPPAVLWDALNQSELRKVLTDDDRFDIQDRKDGRVGPGSVYQCYHGKQVITHVVQEWRPFERIVLRVRFPVPGRPVFCDVDHRLKPLPEGSELTRIFARLTGPTLKRLAARLMLNMKKKESQQLLENFRDAVEADFTEHQELRSELAGSVTPESISKAAATSLHS